MTTDNMDLSAYSEVKIDFSYYPNNIDSSNEDFWLQISTDDSNSFTTVQEWNKDSEFLTPWPVYAVLQKHRSIPDE